MGREIEFGDISTLLGDVEYPLERTAAAEEFADVTVVFADGEANLGHLISETATESFDSATDIETELHNVLPREAVGEPNQSEGDA